MLLELGYQTTIFIDLYKYYHKNWHAMLLWKLFDEFWKFAIDKAMFYKSP